MPKMRSAMGLAMMTRVLRRGKKKVKKGPKKEEKKKEAKPKERKKKEKLKPEEMMRAIDRMGLPETEARRINKGMAPEEITALSHLVEEYKKNPKALDLTPAEIRTAAEMIREAREAGKLDEALEILRKYPIEWRA